MLPLSHKSCRRRVLYADKGRYMAEERVRRLRLRQELLS